MSIRFAFGKNWRQFLSLLSEERILASEHALSSMFGKVTISGATFLDIGSGSGLSSLAARRLGAKVTSFDYDSDSVACTEELKRMFYPDDTDEAWKVQQGSILDRSYLEQLGTFDIVYSWGVLHHTGDMWNAIKNATQLVGPKGTLLVAIYNDQGRLSEIWSVIKRFYNRSGRVMRLLLVLTIGIITEAAGALVRLLTGRNPLPFARWRRVKQERGMSVWYDLVDWVGGYPFEVATPEAIFEFVTREGFILTKLKTKGGGLGCCEYVFSRAAHSS